MRLRTRIFCTLALCGGWPCLRCLPCAWCRCLCCWAGLRTWMRLTRAAGRPSWAGWSAVAAVSAASFAVHELVHAVFFKLLAPAGAQVTFGANRETAMISCLRRGRCVFAPAVHGRLPGAHGCFDGGVCPGVCVLGLSAAVLPGGRLCICRAVWAIGITCGPSCATAALPPARIRPLACAFSQSSLFGAGLF